jgi:large subunit ribosomal protein L25
VQYHPVTDVPIHVDFLRTSADTEIHVFVPVQFLNEDQAPGIKRGGVLNIVRHEIEVYCLAGAIPDHFTVDLAGLDIGDAMRFSNIPVPEGVRPVIAGRDFTVATISASSAVMDEAAAAAAAAAEAEGAEGEVVEGGAAPAADGKSEG